MKQFCGLRSKHRSGTTHHKNDSTFRFDKDIVTHHHCYYYSQKEKTTVSRTFNHTYNCAHEQKKKAQYMDFSIKTQRGKQHVISN